MKTVLELLNAVDRLRQENVTLQRECEELRSRNVGLSQNCALLSNGAAGGKVVDFGVIGPLAGMPLTTSTAATAAPVQAKAPVRRRATKKKSTEDDATVSYGHWPIDHAKSWSLVTQQWGGGWAGKSVL